MSNWKFKKIGKYICIHYFITFLGEHSNVNNVINALLCLFFLLLCRPYRYSWLITFEIFLNFFFWDRGVGGWGVSYPNFFGFLYFFIFTRPLTNVGKIYSWYDNADLLMLEQSIAGMITQTY